MSVDVLMVNERGEQLGVLLDPGGYTSWLLAISDLSNSSCLRFLDPYGNTIFNRLQLPVLIHELERAASCITETAVTAEQSRRERTVVSAQVSAKPVAPSIMRAAPSVTELKDHAGRLIELAKVAQGRVHTYIKFVGD